MKNFLSKGVGRDGLDPGSFRDPSGQVFFSGNDVYRSISKNAQDDWNAVKKTGFIQQLVEEGLLVPWESVTILKKFENIIDTDSLSSIIKMKKLPFISYPYEWSFSALKNAALLHLGIQIKGLEVGVNLIDASAYNIQFQGSRPIFIDHLSFRPYIDGQLWQAHRQFLEQFVTPLLLWSKCKLPFQTYFRGSMDGIKLADVSGFFPIKSYLNWRVFGHILLPVWLDSRLSKRGGLRQQKQKKLSKNSFRAMLLDLRSWISGLSINDSSSSWVGYENDNSYSETDQKTKLKFISEFIAGAQPEVVYDFGCNKGLYSEVAVNSGAICVIGFENDPHTLEVAYQRSYKQNLPFLPLYQNLNDPSPEQGWDSRERQGLTNRIKAKKGFVLAVAIIHHLVITHNVPLSRVIGWIVKHSNQGIIEFVPKSDPMVRKMLSSRTDIFDDYHEAGFRSSLVSAGCKITKESKLSSGRVLVGYQCI